MVTVLPLLPTRMVRGARLSYRRGAYRDLNAAASVAEAMVPVHTTVAEINEYNNISV